MRLKGHLFWTTIYMMIWFLCMGIMNLIVLTIGCVILSFLGDFPDVDQIKRETHRNVLTHNIFFPVIGLLYFMNNPIGISWLDTFFTYICFFSMLTWGHHLALDSVGNIIFKKKATGYYTICLWPSITLNFYFFKLQTRGIRLGGRTTTIYLLTSWILSILIGIIVILT